MKIPVTETLTLVNEEELDDLRALAALGIYLFFKYENRPILVVTRDEYMTAAAKGIVWCDSATLQEKIYKSKVLTEAERIVYWQAVEEMKNEFAAMEKKGPVM